MKRRLFHHGNDQYILNTEDVLNQEGRMKAKYSRELMGKMLHEQEMGKPVAGICQEQGINEKQFYYWKSKYNKGEDGTAPEKTQEKKKSVPKKEKEKKAAVHKVVKKEPEVKIRIIGFDFGTVSIKKGFVLNVEYGSEDICFQVSKEEE